MSNQINSANLVFGAGLIYLALAIVLGAFAAHGLKDILDDYAKDVYFKANFYHFIIAGTILLLASARITDLSIASSLLFLASFIFSGSLYLLALTGIKWLGAITPIGGTLMIIVLIWQGVKMIRAGGAN